MVAALVLVLVAWADLAVAVAAPPAAFYLPTVVAKYSLVVVAGLAARPMLCSCLVGCCWCCLHNQRQAHRHSQNECNGPGPYYQVHAHCKSTSQSLTLMHR